VADSTVLNKNLYWTNTFFVTPNKCMIITRRLCHIMWRRKWHNLLP
jgi:hypothetical protein